MKSFPAFEESARRGRRTGGLHTYVALLDGHFRLEPNGDWAVELPG